MFDVGLTDHTPSLLPYSNNLDCSWKVCFCFLLCIYQGSTPFQRSDLLCIQISENHVYSTFPCIQYIFSVYGIYIHVYLFRFEFFIQILTGMALRIDFIFNLIDLILLLVIRYVFLMCLMVVLICLTGVLMCLL